MIYQAAVPSQRSCRIRNVQNIVPWHLERISQGDLSSVYISVFFPVKWQMGIRAGRSTQDGSLAAVPVCLTTITVCVPRRGGQSASRSPANLPSHYQRSPCWNTMLTSHAKGYLEKRRMGKRRGEIRRKKTSSEDEQELRMRTILLSHPSLSFKLIIHLGMSCAWNHTVLS